MRLFVSDKDKSNSKIFQYVDGSSIYANFSEFKDLCTVKSIYTDGTLEVEFGDYPQNLITDIKIGQFYKTGREYTIFVNGEYIKLEEYIRGSLKFIEFNGQFYRVSPITWIVDVQNDLAAIKDVDSLGIEPITWYFDDIEFIENYLSDYFSKEITTDLEKMQLFKIREQLKEERVKASLVDIENRLVSAQTDLNSSELASFNPELQRRVEQLSVDLFSLLEDIRNGKFDYIKNIPSSDEFELIDVDFHKYPEEDIYKKYPDEDIYRKYPDDHLIEKHPNEGWDTPYIDEGLDRPWPDADSWKNVLPLEIPKLDEGTEMLTRDRIDWSLVYCPVVNDENNLTEEEIAALREWFDRDIYSYLSEFNVDEQVKQEMCQHIEESKDRYRELVSQQVGNISL